MIKIAHLSDIHIRNNERHIEYREVFQKLYSDLKQTKPNLIVIVGDLFESYIDISNEAKIVAGDFLNSLSNIAPIRIVKGNHDVRKKAISGRINSVKTIVDLIHNDSVIYINDAIFFNDPYYDITWVNHPYGILDNNPWTINNYIKVPNQIYISLFHDPILGCKSATETFDNPKYKNLSEFDKSDFAFLGDIHLTQFFRNKQIAYCGSLIQQNFGELTEDHGYLLWEIKDKNNFGVKLREISNDYNYITFNLTTDTDYDLLDFKHDILNEQSQLRVIWNDISSNMTDTNKNKIKSYFKTKYNKWVRIDKKEIVTNSLNSIIETKNLDLNDRQTQLDIYKEYLKLNKYSDDVINKILDLDHIINERLTLQETNLNSIWDLDKIWFNNFKSYGDDNVIDFKNKNGIYQLNGINKQGKTTILDAICYVLYGVTTSTLKKEKFADLQYINNKRDLNYCLVGAVITINGNNYTLVRKTTVFYKKNGVIDKVQTVLDYYDGVEEIEDNKLTGERLIDTQKLLDKSLGDFDQFTRLSFTNADNLNKSLSTDRAVFIDSLLSDLGLGIFEKKLEEFKLWEKEQNLEKLKDKIEDIEDKIELNNDSIIDIDADIQNNKDQKELLIKNISKYEELKDLEIKKLNKIDDEIKDLNLYDINETISDINENISENDDKVENIDLLLNSIIIDSDINNKINDKNTKLNNLNESKNKTENSIAKIEQEISKSNLKITNLENSVTKLQNSNITLINDTINKYNSDITDYKNIMINLISDKKNELTNLINSNDIWIKTNNDSCGKLKQEGKVLKTEIDELENTNICPTCKKPFNDDKEYIQEINNLILSKKNLLKTIITEYKSIESNTEDLIKQNKTYNDNLTKLNNKDYTFDSELLASLKAEQQKINTTKQSIEDYKSIIKGIENNIYSNSEFKDKYDLIVVDIENENQIIEDKTIQLEKLQILDYEDNITTIKKEIEDLLLKQKLVDKKNKLTTDKNNLLLEISNYKLELVNNNLLIEKINNSVKLIEQNKIIELKIEEFKDIIKELNDEIKHCDAINVENIVKKITFTNENIVLNDKKEKIKKQKEKEDLYNLYKQLVHRDGIPSYLINKNINKINNELETILEEVDFILYFNQNIELKMSNKNRLDVCQNAIVSSGAERTFCSLALKTALYNINCQSKADFIILDEVFGKLVENSVEEFTNLLYSIKNKINKILIIEHIHNIEYDYLITAIKDQNGISNLVIE